MSTDLCETDFVGTAARLKADPVSVPWPDRCELARRLGEALSAGNDRSDAMALVQLLARDSKWEVRAEIAQLLPVISDADFQELAPLLAGDCNHIVCQAAQRAIARRRKLVKRATQTQRAADHIADDLRSIATKHGSAVATKAKRLCDRHSELVVGSMVHDMRSLIVGITSDVTAIVEEFGKRRRQAVRLRGNLDHALRTLDDMQAYTRPLSPERHREWLSQMVASALEMARDNVRRQRLDPDSVTVNVVVGESISLEVARHLIVMALANVLTNAFEAFVVDGTELRPGSIDVTARTMLGRVELTIRDDGTGIVEQDLASPSFFLPGRRRNATKRHSTGYGLAIAMRNLSAHGGTLKLESRPDEGTTVRIVLPLRQTDEGPVS